MEPSLIAQLGLARLRLPVPTSKYVTIHAAAEALQDGEIGGIMWDALIEWISGLDLESEVIESLCIPLLARSDARIDINVLERAIARPSPLSSIYLNRIAKRPLLVNTWAKCHSMELPFLFSPDEVLDELTDGRIVPPILAHRLEKLERKSGQPFLKQWAFEFQRLVDAIGELRDGYWEYFIDGERDQRSVGQFITRRGQAARSAYLRALSLAYDCWNMPEDLVYNEAMYATPADFTFLRMPPGDPPPWLSDFSETTPASLDEWHDCTNGLIERAAEYDTSELLYLNLPISRSKMHKSDLEIVSCLSEGTAPNYEDVFRVHEFLPGRIELQRSENGTIQCGEVKDVARFPSGEKSSILPALLPCVVRHFGYLHSDLLERSPCLPATYSSDDMFLAVPRSGGMDLVADNKVFGELRYWNWKWSAVHDKALGPHCGLSVVVSNQRCKRMLSVPGMTLHRYWRAKILRREKEYGDWEERVLYGSL